MNDFELLVKHEAKISNLEENIEKLNDRMKFQYRKTSKLKTSIKKNKILTGLSIISLAAAGALSIREIYKAELKIDELEKKIDSCVKVKSTEE